MIVGWIDSVGHLFTSRSCVGADAGGARGRRARHHAAGRHVRRRATAAAARAGGIQRTPNCVCFDPGGCTASVAVPIAECRSRMRCSDWRPGRWHQRRLGHTELVRNPVYLPTWHHLCCFGRRAGSTTAALIYLPAWHHLFVCGRSWRRAGSTTAARSRATRTGRTSACSSGAFRTSSTWKYREQMAQFRFNEAYSSYSSW